MLKQRYAVVMKNLFDLATPEELELILGEDDPDLSAPMRGYAFEARRAREEPDYHYSLLSTLYANRDNMALADKYVAMIKDDDFRLCASMMLHECTAGY